MGSSSTDTREIRRFGLVLSVLFVCLAALAGWRQSPLAACLFGPLGVLGACFVLFPSATRPLHRGWMKGSRFLARIVTACMLTLAYFLVITPAAWLKRLFGGRPLPVRPDRRASSYWVRREEPSQPRERFIKRF